ncbi:MAG: hypothetical protein A2496_04990 [Burkholderiales bacterium RIFOXYC12_FULL_60_6]|nr:MAG: hypothetical protein A2496_04990 [Burkholderiales bacterium RIFOXYC12_FULL_60_6]
MSNSMFYTGLSGLNVAQAALVTTDHNTANVGAAGYSRQSVQMASSSGVNMVGIGFFGSGAKVVAVTRSYDQYLASQLVLVDAINQRNSPYAGSCAWVLALDFGLVALIFPFLITLKAAKMDKVV